MLYCESQISNLSSQKSTLQQALADSTKAHGSVIEAFNQFHSLVKVVLPTDLQPSNERIQLKKAMNDIDTTLECLRSFQQVLQRSLINENLQLPEPKYIPPKLTYCRLPSSQLDLSSSGTVELEEKEEEWSKERARLKQEVKKLKNELEAVKKEQMWPFGDDVRSHSDSFGMSSNSKLVKRSPSRAQERLEQGSQVQKLKEEVEALKQEHKREKERLMSQAEAEIRDSCRKVHALQQQLRKMQDVTQSDSLVEATRHVEPEKYRRTDRATSMPAGMSRESKYVGLSLRSTDNGRVDEVIENEKQSFSGLKQHDDAFDSDVEKANRDRELFSKEQRASQVRHQALLEDLSAVLEERDKALAETCAQRRVAAIAEKTVKDLKNELEAAISKVKKADAKAQNLKEEKAKLNVEIDQYVRAQVNLEQDVEVLQKRLQSVELERDAAIKEQHHALARVDRAAEERRAVFQERFEANAKTEEAERRLHSARDAIKRCEAEKTSLEKELVELQTELAQARATIEERRGEQDQSLRRLALEKEDRQCALQELETAQRQLNALKKEMKSVLRVRDIALEQRDLAVNELRRLQKESPRRLSQGNATGFSISMREVPRTEIFLDKIENDDEAVKREQEQKDMKDTAAQLRAQTRNLER